MLAAEIRSVELEARQPKVVSITAVFAYLLDAKIPEPAEALHVEPVRFTKILDALCLDAPRVGGAPLQHAFSLDLLTVGEVSAGEVVVVENPPIGEVCGRLVRLPRAPSAAARTGRTAWS